MVLTSTFSRALPLSRLVVIPIAPSGSTPMILTSGWTCLTAAPTPEISPPPPTATSKTSISFDCSTISNPSVAVPCRVLYPSKGWMMARPSVSAMRNISSKAVSILSEMTTSAPKALARLTRKGFAVLCMTTFAFTSRALLA